MKFFNIALLCLSVGLVGCQHNVHQTVQSSHSLEEAYSDVDYSTFTKHKQKQKPVIALVLGSGGARGYAHIGVIEVLEQNGIKPDFIVGTSAGSVVGSIYASGKSAEELRQIALDMQVHDVRNINIRKKGVLDGGIVEEYVNNKVDQLKLEDLKIPMYVVATELKSGEKVVFNKGSTGQAVRASISIPSMFIPAKISGKEYVDGGLVSPVPVNVARQLGADIVIAVDILPQPMHAETKNIWGMFNQNIYIMQTKMAEQELKHADVVIRPDLRERLHIFDMKGKETTMQLGMDAAAAQINTIEQVIDAKSGSKARYYSAKK